ncbi:unnamed protein product [Closterium sp. NIES-53]
MYLMTCTRPDLAYPLSLLARYVAPGWHQKVQWDAAMRVRRYLCSTSGMGLVLGGRARVVLTGHADASWVDDLAKQRSSQGYTLSLGSSSVSWRSICSSSILSSSCEAAIYAGAMAADELRWLTYLLTDLGEAPCSPLVLYQRGQLRLAYVAIQANTPDIFTKALQPCDHQRFCTVLVRIASTIILTTAVQSIIWHWNMDFFFPPAAEPRELCIQSGLSYAKPASRAGASAAATSAAGAAADAAASAAAALLFFVCLLCLSPPASSTSFEGLLFFEARHLVTNVGHSMS